ncbi:MAG: polysaccharide pyruvyl transferase family protein [Lachnospiraceae bacterium]
MRVGILSMQRIPNYGSFMQALALKNILEERGHEVTFVDIQKNEHINNAKGKSILWKLGKLKNIDGYLLRRIIDSKKNKKLDIVFKKSQEKYLNLDRSWMGSNGCDAVVIGSDEIFNCSSESKWGINGQRFGDIHGVNIVVSYAASCGYTDASNLKDEDRETIEIALKKMTKISVRDKNTVNFIDQLIDKIPEEHLDPVLIYDLEKFIIQEDVPEEAYMIIYAYHNRIKSKNEIQAIKSYAHKHHLRTVAVGGSLPWCDEFVVLSPFQVLAYFKNAVCIVTDTFHGTIFSVKFNKPFAVIVRDSNANKLDDLLERLKITNHKVTDLTMLEDVLSQQDDLKECHDIIEHEKKRSFEYIESVGL